MRILPLLSVLTIVLAVLSAGVLGFAHESGAMASMSPSQSVPAQAPCCDDHPEPGASCQILQALPLASEGLQIGRRVSQGVAPIHPLLLAGIRPASPLDPPRSA